jgi:ADP-heptose:LPS heptosyltransferase
MSYISKVAVAKQCLGKGWNCLEKDWTGRLLLKRTANWALLRAWRTIGRPNPPRPEQFVAVDANTVSVAVQVSGGIGDYVVIARVLRDLAAHSPALRFHVFCHSPENGRWVFDSLPCVEGVFDVMFFSMVRQQYDCALIANEFICADEAHLRLARITRLAPRFAQAIAHSMKARKRWDVYIEHHPRMDGAFAHTAVALGFNRYTFLHSFLGLTPGPLSLPLACDDTIADELSARFGRWITINTGFDVTFQTTARTATKCYPAQHWRRFVAAFKEKCRDVAVVQIGAKTSVSIPGVDEDLVSATTLAQAAAILSRATVHVDNEGGLVHIAASLGRRSIVLFGPTSLKFFGYPGNINLTSEVCGDCWWADDRWMDRCPQGYEKPKCLLELDPERVADVAIQEASRAVPVAQSRRETTMAVAYRSRHSSGRR